MQAISQTFFNCVLVLLITLAASVFTIHAQEIPDGPQSVQNAAIPVFQVVPISKSSTSSQRIRSHLDAHNLLLIDPASEAPQQTSGGGNSGYVFPSKHERLKRYIWETVGPLSLVSIGIVAGFDQDQKDPPEWGQGASGYGKRYASRLGQYAIERYCQLNSRRNKISDSDKMNPPFVMWLINDRLDANRLFPDGESRFHHDSVTARAVQMSPHSEV